MPGPPIRYTKELLSKEIYESFLLHCDLPPDVRMRLVSFQGKVAVNKIKDALPLRVQLHHGQGPGPAAELKLSLLHKNLQ